MNLWRIYHPDIPGFLQEFSAVNAMIRLKDVGMNCGCEYTRFPLFTVCGPYSRFDHSLGVALIVWHFTRDKAQTIAGLLHDIATPAFAHVIDFLHGDYIAQESTESRTAEIIHASREIACLLEKHGLADEDVCDYHKYPLADNASPMLSADRLEYTLGNAVNYGFINEKQAAVYYSNLIVGINESGTEELMFSNADIAHSFAMTSLECAKVYASDPDRYAMQILSELICDAINLGVITEHDLYTTERIVVEKIKNSLLNSRWKEYCGLRLIFRQDDPGINGKWRRIYSKKRCIDPYITNTCRVTDLFPDYNKLMDDFKKESQDYWLYAY